MIKRALLVHPAAYSVAESMTQWLNDSCHELDVKIRLDPERYREEAEVCLKEESYDLLITHLNIQNNMDTSLEDQQHRQNGLELLKKLRVGGNNIPVLIVSPMADDHTYGEVERLAPAELVVDGINLERDFIQACIKLHRPTAGAQEPDKTVDVDIAILQDPRSSHYFIKGIGFAFEDEGSLFVNSENLKSLGKLSDEIAKETEEHKPRWRDDFLQLGKNLHDMLFNENNKRFQRSYNNVLGLVGNKVENFRFRFKVEEDTYRIVFEALSRDNNDFIMIHAPMYRRLIMQSDRYALYHDPVDKQRCLRCLVIYADVSGKVSELGIELDQLENIAGEVDFWDVEIRANPVVADVKIIDRGEDGMSFYETVMKYLNSHWDIVHFAGHSAYRRKTLEDDSKKGYLFFPAEDGIETVELDQFATLLYDAYVRLVYLSSCRSSEKGFVFEMVRQNVPAAIGFRWSIDDPKAEKFTKQFYTHLLEDKSLEGAFLKARKDLFHAEYKDPIWAAAMLIVQI